MNRDALRQSLVALGRRAARQQDERLGTEPSDDARVAFQRGWAERAKRETGMAKTPRTGRPAALAAVGAGVLMAGAAAVIFLWLRPATAMSFRVREEPGQVGAWLPSTTDLPVVFSDGTSLTFDRDSVAKVSAVTATGAEVEIPEGRVRAAVVHTTRSRWIMTVGPFAVHVTGTRFDASWNARDRIFTLDLQEGSVMVDGCAIAPHAVRAGSSVVRRPLRGQDAARSKRRSTLRLSPSRAVEAGASDEEASRLVAGADVSTGRPWSPPVALPDAPHEAGRRSGPPSWRELAAQGHSRAALAAALDHFDDESHERQRRRCHAARRPGSVCRRCGARRGSLFLRFGPRFAVTPRAATAAFLLGRLAFDAGAFGEASKWFEQAAAEAPNGPLARETAGRLIEARENAGSEHLAARAAAQRATGSAYPPGPDASLAIRILQP